MPKVFVPHQALRYDEDLHRRVPVRDISSASQFGELEIILESSQSISVTKGVQSEIKERMADFKDGDYILALGDPVVIAACVMHASKVTARVNMLKWNRDSKAYMHECLTTQNSPNYEHNI